MKIYTPMHTFNAYGHRIMHFSTFNRTAIILCGVLVFAIKICNFFSQILSKKYETRIKCSELNCAVRFDTYAEASRNHMTITWFAEYKTQRTPCGVRCVAMFSLQPPHPKPCRAGSLPIPRSKGFYECIRGSWSPR